MSLFTAFAVYFIIWWMSLFLVLPFGVRSQAENGEVISGTDPGAPANSRLGLKLVVNTALSAGFFAVWYYLTYVLGYSLSDIPSVFRAELND
jgi:predicted secreted protein